MNSIFYYYAPPSAEDSTSSGPFSIMRQVVYVCRQTAQKRGVHPDDAFYASVRLHAIAPRHIRVSPYPDGDRCKATPIISTNQNLKRTTIK